MPKYCASGFYPTKAVSEEPYQALQETLRKSKSDCSIFRITVDPQKQEGQTIIVLMGTSIDTTLQTAIDTFFSGNSIDLPLQTREQLWARRAHKRPDATPLPDSAFRYTERHTPTVIDASGREIANMSPLSVGSKFTIQTIPFIKGYEAIEAGLATSEVTRDYYKKFGNTPLPTDVQGIISNIVNAGRSHLRLAGKYRFTPSALAMHNAVVDLSNTEWVEPDREDIWIEFDTPINTPYGDNIKAVYLTYHNLIHQITGRATKDNYKIPHGITGNYTFWHLLIISTRCEWIYRYAYRLPEKLWTYNETHVCPYNCVHPLPGYVIDHKVLDSIQYPKCKQARDYWLSWLRTALKMIAGEYATSPNPEQFQIEPLPYTSEEKVTVGKGKNQRRINQTITRHIDYRVVSYDVSVAKPLLPEHEQAIEHTGDKRLNWLVSADRASIIWEKRKLPAYHRRYPTRKDGTRQPGIVHIKEPFYKWVPMLTPGDRAIKKIVASKFESK